MRQQGTNWSSLSEMFTVRCVVDLGRGILLQNGNGGRCNNVAPETCHDPDADVSCPCERNILCLRSMLCVGVRRPYVMFSLRGSKTVQCSTAVCYTSSRPFFEFHRGSFTRNSNISGSPILVFFTLAFIKINNIQRPCCRRCPPYSNTQRGRAVLRLLTEYLPSTVFSLSCASKINEQWPAI